MFEPILITTAPIVASLVALTGLRLCGAMSSETEVIAEFHLPAEENETGVSSEEAEHTQALWRRSYAK